MRNFILTSLSLLSLITITTASTAADLSRPREAYKTAAPVYVVTPPNWTGWYGGVNLGYGFERFSGSNGMSPSTGDFTFGSQLGYNFQSGSWLYGLEGDLQATTGRVAGATSTCGGVTCTTGAKINGLATLRGRVGAIMGNNTLVYGTGGLAFVNVGSSFTVAGFPGVDVHDWRTGYALGAGIEQMMWSRWSWKAEYLYVAAKGPSMTSGPFTQELNVRDHLLRVGLNYHF